MKLPPRSLALILATTTALVCGGALFASGRLRALFGTHPAIAAVAPPAPVPAPAGSAAFVLPSTKMNLTSLRLFDDEGWALTDESDLVHVTKGGEKLAVVGPRSIVASAFVGAGTAFVATSSSRGGSVTIHRTTDGGRTFNSFQIDAGTRELHVEGLAFRSAEEGIVAIREDAATTCCGTWSTSDGGRTFRQLVADDTRAVAMVGDEPWIEREDESIVAWSHGRTVVPRGLGDCEVDLTRPLRAERLQATCDTGTRWFVRRAGVWTDAGPAGDVDDWGFVDELHGWRSRRSSDGPRVIELTRDGARSWTPVAGVPPDVAKASLVGTTLWLVSRSPNDEDGDAERLYVSHAGGPFVQSTLVIRFGEHVELAPTGDDGITVAIHGSDGTRLWASKDGGAHFVQRFAE